MSSHRDMETQYRAVRENAGIFNRSKRGKVRAEGADCPEIFARHGYQYR